MPGQIANTRILSACGWPPRGWPPRGDPAARQCLRLQIIALHDDRPKALTRTGSPAFAEDDAWWCSQCRESARSRRMCLSKAVIRNANGLISRILSNTCAFSLKPPAEFLHPSMRIGNRPIPNSPCQNPFALAQWLCHGILDRLPHTRSGQKA